MENIQYFLMFLNTTMPLSNHPLVPVIGDYRPFSLKNPLHVVNGNCCLLSMNRGGKLIRVAQDNSLLKKSIVELRQGSNECDSFERLGQAKINPESAQEAISDLFFTVWIVQSCHIDLSLL
jgi:hypothetical protein